MKTDELAKLIYNHVNSIQHARHGEHWDEWDDKREIEWIRRIIDDYHNTKETGYGGGFQNSGVNETDGMSGFRG